MYTFITKSNIFLLSVIFWFDIYSVVYFHHSLTVSVEKRNHHQRGSPWISIQHWSARWKLWKSSQYAMMTSLGGWIPKGLPAVAALRCDLPPEENPPARMMVKSPPANLTFITTSWLYVIIHSFIGEMLCLLFSFTGSGEVCRYGWVRYSWIASTPSSSPSRRGYGKVNQQNNIDIVWT